MNRDQLIQEGRRKLSKFQQKKKETSLNDLDVLATDAIDFVERSSVQDLTANDQEVVKGFPDETAALCSNPQPNYQNPIIALPSSPHLTPNSQAISLESSRNEYLEKLNTNLHNENNSLILTIEKLQSDIALLENEKLAVNRHLEAMETQKAIVDAESFKLKSLLQTEQNKADLILKELSNLREKCSAAKSIENDLLRNLESTSKDLKDLREINSELEKEKAQLMRKLEDEQVKTAELADVSQNLKQAHESLIVDNRRIKDDLTSSSSEVQSMKQLVDRLQSKLHQSESLASQLSADNLKLTDKCTTIEKQLRAFSDKAVEMERAQLELQSLNENLSFENNRLLSELNDRESTLDVLHRDNHTLRERVDALSEQLVIKEDMMENHNGRLLQAESSLADMQNELDKYVEALSEEEAVKSDIYAQLEISQKKMADQANQIFCLEREKVSIAAEFDTMRQRHFELIMRAAKLVDTENVFHEQTFCDYNLPFDFLINQLSIRSSEFDKIRKEIAEASASIDKAYLESEIMIVSSSTDNISMRINTLAAKWKERFDDLYSVVQQKSSAESESRIKHAILKERMLEAERILQDESDFLKHDFSDWSDDEGSSILAIVLTNFQQHYTKQITKFESLSDSFGALKSTLVKLQKDYTNCENINEEFRSRNRALEEQLISMKEALEDTTNRWKHACTEVAQKMSDIERLSKETDNLEEEVAGAENRRTELEKILAHERKSASESLVAMEHLLESERGRAANLAQNLKQMSSDLLEPLKRENDALRCKCEEISAALQSMQSMVENLNGVNKDKGPFFESLSSEYHIDLLKAEEAILLLNNELDNRSNLLAAARRERDRFFSELEVLKQRLHESEPALNISPVFDQRLATALSRTSETVDVIDRLIDAKSPRFPDTTLRFCLDELAFVLSVCENSLIATVASSILERITQTRKTTAELFSLWNESKSITTSASISAAYPAKSVEWYESQINHLEKAWRHELKINEVLSNFLDDARTSLAQHCKQISATPIHDTFSEVDHSSEIEKLRRQHRTEKHALLERFRSKVEFLELEKARLIAEIKRHSTTDCCADAIGKIDFIRKSDFERFLSTERERHRRHCKTLVDEISLLRFKYKRLSGFRADLVYQKKYLLLLLGGAEAM